MNAIFTAFGAASILILLFTEPENALPAFTSGAAGALKLAVTLFASYAFWLSVIKIFEETGIAEKLKKLFAPLIKKLFPGESDDALTHISTNFAANFIGAGGAATPEGLKAAALIRRRKNLVMLVVMNSTSFQLLPTTVLALRSSLGATSDIILPSLIASAVTTVTAIVTVKVFVR